MLPRLCMFHLSLLLLLLYSMKLLAFIILKGSWSVIALFDDNDVI